MTAVAQIHRHRTAIQRRRLSRPVQLLLDDGLLRPDVSFFDYGCGHAEDIEILARQGFSVAGWDPHFRPTAMRASAPIVNLGYVLNIIDDQTERRETLQQAWELAVDLLCVSVMIRDPGPCGSESTYADGVLTSWGTFQRYYQQREFHDYLASSLSVAPTMAGVGIAYVFKSPRFQDDYVRGRIKPGTSAAIREAENMGLVARWLELYHELGRVPTRAEFPDLARVTRIFGNEAHLIDSVRAEISEESVRESAERRKTRTIVSVCRSMIRQNGAPRLKDLLPEERDDVRIFFGNFDEISAQSRARLKELAELENVSRLMQESTVGKLLPDDLYVHIDALAYLPEMLQVLVELALMILPKDVSYNLIKIARNSWHITFMEYEQFMDHPHPSLRGSMKVLLHKNQLQYRNYSKSDNPPILHRKELFLHPNHERYEEFSQLSRAEEDAGLLGRRDIGTRKQWEAVLAAGQWCIEGHSLIGPGRR